MIHRQAKSSGSPTPAAPQAFPSWMLLRAAAWTPSGITTSPGFTVKLENLPEAPISWLLLSLNRQHGTGNGLWKLQCLLRSRRHRMGQC